MKTYRTIKQGTECAVKKIEVIDAYEKVFGIVSFVRIGGSDCMDIADNIIFEAIKKQFPLSTIKSDNYIASSVNRFPAISENKKGGSISISIVDFNEAGEIIKRNCRLFTLPISIFNPLKGFSIDTHTMQLQVKNLDELAIFMVENIVPYDFFFEY